MQKVSPVSNFKGATFSNNVKLSRDDGVKMESSKDLWIVELELSVYRRDKSIAGNISVDNKKHLISFTYL